MKVVVCIGSSCHLKGSREVVEKLQNLINDNDLKDKVTLSGKFCMGNCQNGVSVKDVSMYEYRVGQPAAPKAEEEKVEAEVAAEAQAKAEA